MTSVLAGTALLALLVGCGSVAHVEADPSARALLDSTTGEIVLPLSEYDLETWEAHSTFNHARDIAVARCMARQGLTYSAARHEPDPESSTGDRTYGLWDVESARRYGYESAVSAKSRALQADAAAGGQTWTAAYEACGDDLGAEVEAFYPSNEDVHDSLTARLRTEAYNAASVVSEWQEAREGWWACLRDKGLSTRPEASAWSSKQALDILTSYDADGNSPDKEEEIRIAVIEATCNVETGLSQRLGDLEAGYQQALIDRNQAALNEEKTKNQERLEAARDYIARNG